MLTQMTIRNFALIEAASVLFRPGFSVVTGETGAGKSIVVDSVNFILGARMGKEIIRTGTDKAVVEAQFSVDGNPRVLSALAIAQIEPEDGYITIQRELSQTGRGVCRVCGAIVTQSQLREITKSLVDIHGQHEHQSLLDSGTHEACFDSCGDESHRYALKKTEESYEALAAVDKKLKARLKAIRAAAERRDILDFQFKELKEAKLKSGEFEELSERRKRMQMSEKLTKATVEALSALDGETGAIAQALSAASAMKRIADTDETYDSIEKRLRSAYYELSDIKESLDARLSEDSLDENALEKLDDRLDELRKLMRKYGMTVEDMLKKQSEIAQELEAISGSDEITSSLKREWKKRREEYLQSAGRLHESRLKLKESFEKAMKSHLIPLGMPDAVFEASIAENEQGRFTKTGYDKLEFLFSANPGEPVKSLSATASGGELSRVMLSLKTMNASREMIPTVIFDEIDTGISGRMAQAVAEKMADIGRYCQVLCVSHLPQIAAMADTEYSVSKSASMGRTHTEVKLLERVERENEIARMVSGADDIDESSLSHARTLLKAAENRKAGK